MNNQRYYSDKPISDIKDDLFNRSKFAEELVGTFRELDNKECYTIGLYAKWGSGKTSTINLIRQMLKNEEKFSVIYIDAWEHDGRIADMQYEIANQIVCKEKGKKDRKKIRNTVKSILKGVPDDFSVEGVSIPVSKIGNVALSAFENRKLKNALEKDIQKSNRKYIIFIDNIDRLNSSSILNVLRLVNQLANYGGATYLVPFDKEYVCKSIENELPEKISGEEYLEKIINLPLNLPSIPQSDIDRVFLNALSEIFKNEKINIKEEEINRFRITYLYYGTNNYLKTPRDIKRVINSLKFVLPCKKNNVNIIDLVLMEILRIFDSHFYSGIYNSKLLLISGGSIFTSRYDIGDRGNDKKKADLKLLTQGDEQREQILAQLFPYVKTLLWNGSREDANKLRKDKRIASEHYFDIYFAPLDDLTNIADEKVTDLLEHSSSKEEISDRLNVITKPSNYDTLLRKIADNTGLIKNRVAFCECLLDLAGETYERHAAFDLSLSERTLFTIDDILKKSSTKLNDYIQLLTYNYEHNRFQTVPYLIRQVVLYSDKERSSTGAPTLNQDELHEYKKHALEIIRNMATKDAIPWNTTDESAFVYHYWSELAGKNEVSKYVKKHIKTAEDAIDFISQFLGVWSEMGSNKYKRGDLNVTTINQINNYVDASFLFDKISKDKKYGTSSDIKEEDLVSFEAPFQRDNSARIAKLGNEHTEAFRKIIAQRYLYYYRLNEKDFN